VYGQSVAVLVSRAIFDHLTGNDQSLVQFMRQSPLYGADDIKFDRDSSMNREASL